MHRFGRYHDHKGMKSQVFARSPSSIYGPTPSLKVGGRLLGVQPFVLPNHFSQRDSRSQGSPNKGSRRNAKLKLQNAMLLVAWLCFSISTCDSRVWTPFEQIGGTWRQVSPVICAYAHDFYWWEVLACFGGHWHVSGSKRLGIWQ